MTKKSKGFSDNMQIGTMPDLLKIINEELEKRQKEAAIKRDMNSGKLDAAFQEEKRITGEIKKARKIVNSMEMDFSELEMNTEIETKKQVEKGLARESDVRAGRITLKEFNQRGRYDKQISEEIVKGVAEKLESASKILRSKNLEILKLEKLLYECQDLIRGLILQPGFFVLEVLKNVREFGDHELALFLDELPDKRVALNEVKRKLLLCEGKSIGGGQRWDRQTVKEARRLQFSPIIPQNLIPKLLSELSQYPDNEMVSVHFLFHEKDIDVTCLKIGRRAITTSKVTRKVLSTSTFTLDGEGMKR